MKIYKYVLEITDEQTCKMPSGAVILSAQMQGKSLCIWAMVDPEKLGYEFRHIRIIGTGHPFSDYNRFRFIDTVQDGQFVWHVFEKIA